MLQALPDVGIIIGTHRGAANSQKGDQEEGGTHGGGGWGWPRGVKCRETSDWLGAGPPPLSPPIAASRFFRGISAQSNARRPEVLTSKAGPARGAGLSLEAAQQA